MVFICLKLVNKMWKSEELGKLGEETQAKENKYLNEYRAGDLSYEYCNDLIACLKCKHDKKAEEIENKYK